MGKFKFILLMVMAASMGWWVIPIALVIWIMVKSFSSGSEEKLADTEQA